MAVKRNIPVKLVYKDGASNVRFANHFSISQVDMDVVIDVGFVDLKDVIDINRKMETNNLQPDDYLQSNVFIRLGLSIGSLVKLKQQLDDVVASLERKGVLVKKSNENFNVQ